MLQVTVKLREYQTELVEKAAWFLGEKQGKVLIVSACGSGKSVMIGSLAKQIVEAGERILFLVHRRELCDQIEGTFKWMEVNLKNVDILTVVTARNRMRKHKLATPDVIITDETHHATAKTYREIYSGFNRAKRLGFTATPIRMNGEGFDDIYDHMLEGPSVQWLIDHDYLADFSYYTASIIDEGKLKRSKVKRQDFTNGSIDKAFGADKQNRPVIYGKIIDSWLKYAKGLQTIVYCHSIEFSKEVAKSLTDAGYPAVHCDGKTPKAEREEIMRKFKRGEIKILVNVDLVSEGFDVPDCQCVVMLRPTESLALYLQQSMRCMRYKAGKKAVIIDQVANCDRLNVLPNKPIKWTLKGRKKDSDEKTKRIQICENCATAWYPDDNKRKGLAWNRCPNCGFVATRDEEERKEAALEIDQQATLKKISTDFKFTINADAVEIENLYHKVMEGKATDDEIHQVRVARGYKAGWEYYQKKRRHQPTIKTNNLTIFDNLFSTKEG